MREGVLAWGALREQRVRQLFERRRMHVVPVRDLRGAERELLHVRGRAGVHDGGQVPLNRGC
jgi:hypothetical protein